MLEQSASYKAAITADARRILLKAVVDISDPDLQFLEVQTSGGTEFSQSGQLHDKVLELPETITLEANHWILGRKMAALSDSSAQKLQVGFVGDAVSGADGLFSGTVFVEQQFSGVDVLQACSVLFSSNAIDGVAEDFVVEIYQGGTVRHTQTVTGNAESYVNLTGFTVHNADAIRVTISKWSLPGRRPRVAEIVPGIYEIWDGRMIAELGVTQKGDVSCLALPFGTCNLAVNNADRRFEWRNKDGLFQSLQERQGIAIQLGVRLSDGSVDYKQVGMYYQKDPGWKTSDYGMTLTWTLVDIIGLLAERTFLPPDPLPTTLEGWVASVVSELGTNFADHYHVDPDYADLPVTANSAEDVTGKRCGDILRWACQATGTWPRAASGTGYLAVEPLWNQGNTLKLTQIYNYPTASANDDLAMLIFQLADENKTQVVIPGTNTSSGKSVTIKNPFIHTKEEAITASKLILACYGGNKITTEGRGDPSSEIGDVDTVWLTKGNVSTGRRIAQTFNIIDGFLQACQSTLLQADGASAWTGCAVLTEECTFTAPTAQMRLILVQGGDGSFAGQPGVSNDGDGILAAEGEAGADGQGGKIWYGTISANAGQTFAVSIGAGGAAEGGKGQETTFGSYSSANGVRYPDGFTDLINGLTYGRCGVPSPRANSGDGAQGGAGGSAGYNKITRTQSGTTVTTVVAPGAGEAGAAGASGVAIVFWDKEA